MKFKFHKNGENEIDFLFSVNGEISLKHQFIYGNGDSGVKIKILNINLGGRFFKFLEMGIDKTTFTILRKNFKNKKF